MNSYKKIIQKEQTKIQNLESIKDDCPSKYGTEIVDAIIYERKLIIKRFSDVLYPVKVNIPIFQNVEQIKKSALSKECSESIHSFIKREMNSLIEYEDLAADEHFLDSSASIFEFCTYVRTLIHHLSKII